MSDSSEAKRERRAREMALATAAGANGLWNPADIKARVDAGVEVPTGARLAYTDLQSLLDLGLGGGGSPNETMGLAQYLAANNMTPQDFQAQYGGLPFVFNQDGSVTYDPSAQRTAFEYTPASYGRNQMIGLGLMAALTGAGLAGVGQGAGMAAGDAAAAAGGVDFASSFAPTLTEAAGAVPSLVSPTASLADMAATLGAGGGLEVGGLAGLTDAALGLPAGGLSAALGGTGINIPGAFGNLTLDAAGNLVSNAMGGAAPNLTTTVSGAGTAGGTAGASGTSAATTTAQSALAKLLGIDQGTADLIGKALGLGLGVYGSNQQADASKDLFNQYMGMGAPYRADLAKLNADPSSFYSSPIFQGALQQGSDALARSLSAKVGNPILNPTALQEMQNYTTRGSLDAYNNRWNQLASAGQLGVSQAAPLGQQANAASGNTYNALGAGLASVFGNQRDYAGEFLDLMRNRSSGSSTSGSTMYLPGGM